MTTIDAVVSPAGTGSTYGLVGDVYTVRLSSEQSGGSLCILDARVPPGGGPPPHVHRHEHETFIVKEGEVTFFSPGRRTIAGPGDVVHLAPGVPHAFRNDGAVEARMTILCTPGGFERMVRHAGVPLPDHEASPLPVTADQIDRVKSACPRYGIEFVDGL